MDNPYTPPSLHSPTPPVPRSSWPTPLGIVAMIFGGCAAIISVVNAVVVHSGMQKMLLEKQPATKEFLEDNALMAKVLVPGGQCVLGIACFLGGLFLLQRKPFGRTLSLGWAAAKVAFAAAITPFIHAQTKASMVDAAEIVKSAMKGSPEAADVPQLTQAVELITPIFSFFWAAAFPLFLGIWLNRRKIRTEVASWSQPTLS
jgi:hypothetical protein